MHRLRISASSPWACLANARTVRPTAWHQNRPTTLHCQRVWHGISRVRICSTAADCDLDPRLQLDRGVGESYPSSPRLRGGEEKTDTRRPQPRNPHCEALHAGGRQLRGAADTGLRPPASRCVLAHRTALQSPRPPFCVSASLCAYIRDGMDGMGRLGWDGRDGRRRWRGLRLSQSRFRHDMTKLDRQILVPNGGGRTPPVGHEYLEHPVLGEMYIGCSPAH